MLSTLASLSELDVARVIAMMVRTHTGLSDDPTFPLVDVLTGAIASKRLVPIVLPLVWCCFVLFSFTGCACVIFFHSRKTEDELKSKSGSKRDKSKDREEEKRNEELCVTSWNPHVFVHSVGRLYPHLNWSQIFKKIDLPEFFVPDRQGLELFLNVFRLSNPVCAAVYLSILRVCAH